jgi:hypothetical protein
LQFVGILLFGASAAQSQSVYKYNSDTIDSSIKCELAQTEKLLQGDHPDATRMKAYITISGEETTSRKIGASVGFFIFKAHTSYEQKNTSLRGAKGTRNIHIANDVNCRKSFVVDVGVLSCFQDQRRLFLDNQTITCSQSSTATAVAGADGQFKVWVLNVGPSGEISKTRTWKIDLVAPPEK